MLCLLFVFNLLDCSHSSSDKPNGNCFASTIFLRGQLLHTNFTVWFLLETYLFLLSNVDISRRSSKFMKEHSILLAAPWTIFSLCALGNQSLTVFYNNLGGGGVSSLKWASLFTLSCQRPHLHFMGLISTRHGHRPSGKGTQGNNKDLEIGSQCRFRLGLGPITLV